MAIQHSTRFPLKVKLIKTTICEIFKLSAEAETSVQK